MKPQYKIAIVDDNSFLISSIREKLSFYEDLTISFTTLYGQEALAILEEKRSTDLVIMDIEMPGLNGIETTALIKKKFPQIKVLMLTVFDNDENIFNAIKAGADGYLLKDSTPDELYEAIQQTLSGGAAMTPSIAAKALNLLRNPLTVTVAEDTETVELTKREIEVLEQLAQGLPYTGIAENLFISASTVRKHIENIYHKLQVHSKIEAIQEARNRRIL